MSKQVRLVAVAFDLDGTLIDTAPDIDVALNAALADAGLGAVASADTRRWIGDGPDVLIRRALEHLRVAAEPALVARLRAGFDQATLAAPIERGALFPGMAELLARWQGEVPMAVVTNKPTVLSRRVLEAAGVLHRFAGVHGADTPAQRKPAPALLLEAAAGLGVDAAALLMVGDSVNDLRAAAAAGCALAWAAWGYGGAQPPPAEARGAAPAMWTVGHPAELAAAPGDPGGPISDPRTRPA